MYDLLFIFVGCPAQVARDFNSFVDDFGNWVTTDHITVYYYMQEFWNL